MNTEFEFHLGARRGKVREFSPRIRGKICDWSRRLGLTPFFHQFYLRASEDIAVRFSSLPTKPRIFLRGGALQGIRPGISDLDFVLYFSASADPLKWVNEYLALHRDLKKRYPILGEVMICFPEVESIGKANHTATEIWLNPKWEWEGSWKTCYDDSKRIREALPPQVEFAYSFDWYVRMFHEFSRFEKCPQFAHEVIRKEARKVMGAEFEDRMPKDPVRWLVQVYSKMDELAKKVVPNGTKISFDWNGECFERDAASRYSYLQMKKFGLVDGIKMTRFPMVFEWQGSNESLYQWLIRYRELGLRIMGNPPILLSEKATELMLLGWGSFLSAWDRIFDAVTPIDSLGVELRAESQRHREIDSMLFLPGRILNAPQVCLSFYEYQFRFVFGSQIRRSFSSCSIAEDRISFFCEAWRVLAMMSCQLNSTCRSGGW